MTYQIREAITADLATTWTWRNDPVTRTMARVATQVSWAQYQVWFNTVVRSPDHLLLVAEHGSTLVAYASFAPFRKPKAATISLTIGPDFRGRGHGTALVPLFVEKAADCLGLEMIVAHIRTENTPSHKVFTHAGFRDCGVENAIHRYRLPVLQA